MQERYGAGDVLGAPLRALKVGVEVPFVTATEIGKRSQMKGVLRLKARETMEGLGFSPGLIYLIMSALSGLDGDDPQMAA